MLNSIEQEISKHRKTIERSYACRGRRACKPWIQRTGLPSSEQEEDNGEELPSWKLSASDSGEVAFSAIDLSKESEMKSTLNVLTK